jgi:hypothetical protein
MHTWSKSWVVDFRKESSLSKEKFVLLPDLSLPPTNLQIPKDSKVDDYGKKVRA